MKTMSNKIKIMKICAKYFFGENLTLHFVGNFNEEPEMADTTELLSWAAPVVTRFDLISTAGRHEPRRNVSFVISAVEDSESRRK